MTSKVLKRAIDILLADYMNFLPPGPQEAYVPVGAATTGLYSDWPLTPESFRRMNPNTLRGSTYRKLDEALVWLDKNHPILYTAVLQLRLHDEAGHSDVEWARKRDGYKTLVALYDEALDKLADYLEGADLDVNYPSPAAATSEKDIGDKNHEVYVVYLRYRNMGIPHRQAIKNLYIKFSEYPPKKIEKIISERLSQAIEEYNPVE